MSDSLSPLMFRFAFYLVYILYDSSKTFSPVLRVVNTGTLSQGQGWQNMRETSFPCHTLSPSWRSKKLLKQSLNIFSPLINLIKLEKIAQRKRLKSPEKVRLRTCYRPQFLDLSLARQL